MAANYSSEMKIHVRSMMIDGKSDTEISKITGITTNTLRIWRRNFTLPPSTGQTTRYSQTEKEKSKSLMLKEMSNAEISRLTGIPPTTLANWRREFEIENPNQVISKYSDEKKQEAILLMKQNKTNVDISKELGISAATVGNWRKSANIPNSTKSQNSKKYSPEIKIEALALMSEGMTNSEVNKLLDVHTDTLRNWRKKAGIEPSSGGRKEYTIDQINDVIDLIRDGNTISEISRISGVSQNKIRKVREEEVRSGNPLPEFIKGISRIQKYTDEELIELVYLNPGYGLIRFVDLLGISKNFLFDLSIDFKDFTQGEEDLIAILQDESHGRMVSRKEYFEITGNERVPKGAGASTGGRVPKPDRVGVKGRLLKDVYLPPQIFYWGSVKPKAWREKKRDEIVWIEKRIEQKGYLSSLEDKDDFENETGAGKTKFNKWMNKAGLVFDKHQNRWHPSD